MATFPADGLENTWQEFQKAVLTRWTLDLDSGEMTKEQLDDRSVEFPRIDERRLGRDVRYLFDIGSSDASGQIYEGFTSIIRYGLHSGASTEQHELPAGGHLSEAVFVPRRENGPEGEGYLMLNVYKFNEDRSDYVILDAENLSSGPLPIVRWTAQAPSSPLRRQVAVVHRRFGLELPERHSYPQLWHGSQKTPQFPEPIFSRQPQWR